MEEESEILDKDALLEEINNKCYTLGNYIDISLIKKIDSNGSLENIKIEEIDNEINISIDIPEELINKNKNKINREYYIARSHDGEITFLNTEYNSEEETLSFKTDKFSLYSIVYNDTEIIENPDTYDNLYSYIVILIISIFSLIVILNKKSC